jgi:hypothetical protein
MTSTPYVYERQSEYWTSKQIDDYLLDLQFDVITLPIPTHIEYLVPADFIYFDKRSSKLFGLQYKALYHNERDHWRLDFGQHQTLALYPWIYYCLLEVRAYKEYRAALHLARFAANDFSYLGEIYPENPGRFASYMRWATFFRQLARCKKGVLVSSEDHLKQLLTAGLDDPLLQRLSQSAVDLFLVDFSNSHVIHYTSFLSGVRQ